MQLIFHTLLNSCKVGAIIYHQPVIKNTNGLPAVILDLLREDTLYY